MSYRRSQPTLKLTQNDISELADAIGQGTVTIYLRCKNFLGGETIEPVTFTVVGAPVPFVGVVGNPEKEMILSEGIKLRPSSMKRPCARGTKWSTSGLPSTKKDGAFSPRRDSDPKI